MKKLGVTDQRIVTVGKQLIRNRIIQTRALLAHSSGKPRREWTGQQEQDLRKLAKRRRAATGFSDDDNQLVGTFGRNANTDIDTDDDNQLVGTFGRDTDTDIDTDDDNQLVETFGRDTDTDIDTNDDNQLVGTFGRDTDTDDDNQLIGILPV